MILCCGEALIDMLPIEGDGGGYRPHSGGAAFNTAVALGRLGQKVALVSGLSTDMFGRQLRQELEASGASADFAIYSARPTTLAFVELRDGDASYAFWDQGSAMRDISIEDLPQVPTEISALLFGGISLCNLPMAQTFCHLANSQRGKQVLMLDLNIRPGFAEDEAAYMKRLGDMIAQSDIVKLSQEDLDHYLPGAHPAAEKLLQLRAQAPGLILLTQGDKGAMALTVKGELISVPAEAVAVVDTVGAGDSFNAGFLTALSDAGHLSRDALPQIEITALRTALGFATTVASRSVTRSGANSPWRHEL